MTGSPADREVPGHMLGYIRCKYASPPQQTSKGSRRREGHAGMQAPAPPAVPLLRALQQFYNPSYLFRYSLRGRKGRPWPCCIIGAKQPLGRSFRLSQPLLDVSATSLKCVTGTWQAKDGTEPTWGVLVCSLRVVCGVWCVFCCVHRRYSTTRSLRQGTCPSRATKNTTGIGRRARSLAACSVMQCDGTHSA